MEARRMGSGGGSPHGKQEREDDMNTNVPTSAELIGNLTRQNFGVEPAVMAAMAHGDGQVASRYLPGDDPSTDPLDGLEVLVRRAVALCWALRDHHGAVSLVTERQAAAAGWPDAALANRCVALAWGLFLGTEPTLAIPLLLDPDEDAGTVMVPLIRIDDDLPALDELLLPLHRGAPIEYDALERAADARRDAPAVAGVSIASMQDRLKEWLGIDADIDAVDLACDFRGLRMQGPNGRAVALLTWIITTALELGSVMKRESIEAVRLKTERDAQLAGEPGAGAANCAVLLATAICHGAASTPRVLPTRDDLATTLAEAGRHARDRRGREGDDGEASTVEMLDLRDRAARGYVHVGRANASQVAWRQVRGEG